MDGQMGLLQKPETGNSSPIRELVPKGIAYRLELHFRNNSLEKTTQSFLVAQSRFWTPKDLYQPFNAGQFEFFLTVDSLMVS